MSMHPRDQRVLTVVGYIFFVIFVLMGVLTIAKWWGLL